MKLKINIKPQQQKKKNTMDVIIEKKKKKENWCDDLNIIKCKEDNNKVSSERRPDFINVCNTWPVNDDLFLASNKKRSLLSPQFKPSQ